MDILRIVRGSIAGRVRAHVFNPASVLASGLTLMLLATTAFAADVYRYRNDEGNLVINHTVPPQLTKNGYELIDSSGRVVERVEPLGPEPESEEVEVIAPETVFMNERRDTYLLTSFSAVEEIAAARDRKLSQLSREIEITTASAEKIGQQRLVVEQQAAQFQRGGKEIPETVKKRLAEIDERRQKATEALESRRLDHAKTETLYKTYAKRFRELKGLPPAEPEVPETGSETAPATDPSSAPLASD
ncbi:MAG: hypothetical protein KBT63_07430 [Porticoccaceae bacterium]|nr:hypothetical protein [Porticoccaceae bacterium]